MEKRELHKLRTLGIDYSLDGADGRRRNADGLQFQYGPWDACDKCHSRNWRKYGFDRYGLQRWICMNCRRTILGNQYKTGVFYQEIPFGVFYGPVVGRIPYALKLLCSGRYSVRQVATETGLNKNTVCKILGHFEEWLQGREDLQKELRLTIPVQCQCGQPLRNHVSVCVGRRQRCAPLRRAA